MPNLILSSTPTFSQALSYIELC